MTMQELPCIVGNSVYLTEFSGAKLRFPHHDGPRYSEDHMYLTCERIRTHVCPQCAKLYREWREKHDPFRKEG